MPIRDMTSTAGKEQQRYAYEKWKEGRIAHMGALGNRANLANARGNFRMQQSGQMIGLRESTRNRTETMRTNATTRLQNSILGLGDWFGQKKQEQDAKKAAKSSGGLFGAGGTLAGAAIGTVIAPGIGTMVGAGLGGAAGGMVDAATSGGNAAPYAQNMTNALMGYAQYQQNNDPMGPYSPVTLQTQDPMSMNQGLFSPQPLGGTGGRFPSLFAPPAAAGYDRLQGGYGFYD